MLQLVISIVKSIAIIRLSFVIKDPNWPPKGTLPSRVNILKLESGLKSREYG